MRNLKAAFPAFAVGGSRGKLGRRDRCHAGRGSGDFRRRTETSGLFIASGFSGHGFGIGPGAGRLTAELVTGAPPCVDPAPFRFSRFHDGTPMRPFTPT